MRSHWIFSHTKRSCQVRHPANNIISQLFVFLCFIFSHFQITRENLFYWELIDLLRSPEVVKMLTGSYSKVMRKKRKKELDDATKHEAERLKKE